MIKLALFLQKLDAVGEYRLADKLYNKFILSQKNKWSTYTLETMQNIREGNGDLMLQKAGFKNEEIVAIKSKVMAALAAKRLTPAATTIYNALAELYYAKSQEKSGYQFAAWEINNMLKGVPGMGPFNSPKIDKLYKQVFSGLPYGNELPTNALYDPADKKNMFGDFSTLQDNTDVLRGGLNRDESDEATTGIDVGILAKTQEFMCSADPTEKLKMTQQSICKSKDINDGQPIIRKINMDLERLPAIKQNYVVRFSPAAHDENADFASTYMFVKNKKTGIEKKVVLDCLCRLYRANESDLVKAFLNLEKTNSLAASETGVSVI